MSEVNEKAASDPGLSDEEEEGWQERFENGPPPNMHAGVSQTKSDPRPKYNFLSLLLFLWAWINWHSYS